MGRHTVAGTVAHRDCLYVVTEWRRGKRLPFLACVLALVPGREAALAPAARGPELRAQGCSEFLPCSCPTSMSQFWVITHTFPCLQCLPLPSPLQVKIHFKRHLSLSLQTLCTSFLSICLKPPGWVVSELLVATAFPELPTCLLAWSRIQYIFTELKQRAQGLPWWSSGSDSVLKKCRGPRFDPWSGNKIPHTSRKIKGPGCCN